jgi:hypothetical protein
MYPNTQYLLVKVVVVSNKEVPVGGRYPGTIEKFRGRYHG